MEFTDDPIATASLPGFTAETEGLESLLRSKKQSDQQNQQERQDAKEITMSDEMSQPSITFHLKRLQFQGGHCMIYSEGSNNTFFMFFLHDKNVKKLVIRAMKKTARMKNCPFLTEQIKRPDPKNRWVLDLLTCTIVHNEEESLDLILSILSNSLGEMKETDSIVADERPGWRFCNQFESNNDFRFKEVALLMLDESKSINSDEGGIGFVFLSSHKVHEIPNTYNLPVEESCIRQFPELSNLEIPTTHNNPLGTDAEPMQEKCEPQARELLDVPEDSPEMKSELKRKRSVARSPNDRTGLCKDYQLNPLQLSHETQ